MAKRDSSPTTNTFIGGGLPTTHSDLLTADHAPAFLAVVVDEVMGDPARIPATIKRKQLLADMMLLFHMHITAKGNSTPDIAAAAHVELNGVKSMLTPLVDLGFLTFEYRGNHANRNGSGRVRHYFFSERLVKRTLQMARDTQPGRPSRMN